MADMQGRFGVREICDVTFKALSEMKVGNKTFLAGQPVFSIETAQTSNMEQATTTVYAQGGKGYNRLISWEGEKTMTFTVTDALMSPVGMSVLSGAGLIEAENGELAHVHMTIDSTIDKTAKTVTIACSEMLNELGLSAVPTGGLNVCADVPMYGSILNAGGSVVNWLDMPFTVTSEATKGLVNLADEDDTLVLTLNDQDAAFAGRQVKVDFYVAMNSGVQTVQIEPSSFGGYFYVEADTLFRDEATGKDLAASLIFPKVKVQSAFTFTMAASGDPSTFDFVMDAFPAYTRFNKKKKTIVDIQIVTGESSTADVIDHEETISYDTDLKKAKKDATANDNVQHGTTKN